MAVTARARPPRYAGIAAELAQTQAALRDARELIERARAALDEAPDFPLATEPSRKQALAVQAANVRAWTILTEGRDPPPQRAG